MQASVLRRTGGARTGLFRKRTGARRIHNSVVQSKNLASRLGDLIVTQRFDGNFRIELLPVRQGVAHCELYCIRTLLRGRR